MICAHFVAKILYKKALIEDMFMFQKPPKNDIDAKTYLAAETTVEPTRNTDEFKSIYHETRHALDNNNLQKSHIMSIVNTILRRKRFKMSTCEFLTGMVLKACCCRNKIKDRHRLLDKA